MSWLNPLKWLDALSFLKEVWDVIAALIKKGGEARERKADHVSNVDQATKDTEKLETLKPDATAEEVDEAIDDALDHL